MDMAKVKVLMARLLMLCALACGVIGLVAGFAEKGWKLGVTGWFTGGTLLAVLAIVVLADYYFESRRGQGSS